MANLSSFINFNGRIIEAASLLAGADNRGLRYGDGIFETMRIRDGKILLNNLHFNRLVNSLRTLKMRLPAFFNQDQVEGQILELCRKNGHTASARVRLMYFRGDGGLFDPIEQPVSYVIQTWPLAPSTGELNQNGLITTIFRDGKKTIDAFSHLKTNNFLLYSMAALFAKEQKANDAIILNCNSDICETTIANIFLIKDGEISTPALGSGCIDGVTRRFLLTILPSLGHTIRESAISEEELLNADEVFLTNAIHGIRWVSTCGGRIYDRSLTEQLSYKISIGV